MTDQNRKTLRHFQCRDYLWEIFSQMSQELECSVDYLINEAMRQYARSRNYGTRPGTMSTVTAVPGTRPAGNIPSLGSGAGAVAAPPQARMQPPVAPPPSRGSSPQVGLPTPPPRPAPPPPFVPPSHTGASTNVQAGAAQPRPPVRESTPPPLPQRSSSPNVAHGMLYVVFNGQKIPVAKPEFVIGRGSKTADLAIRDGNISRRHCAIVQQGGQYFMKDLGSTNGVEFGGKRVDTKLIEEGDVYQICDYELRFTYR